MIVLYVMFNPNIIFGTFILLFLLFLLAFLIFSIYRSWLYYADKYLSRKHNKELSLFMKLLLWPPFMKELKKNCAQYRFGFWELEREYKRFEYEYGVNKMRMELRCGICNSRDQSKCYGRLEDHKLPNNKKMCLNNIQWKTCRVFPEAVKPLRTIIATKISIEVSLLVGLIVGILFWALPLL